MKRISSIRVAFVGWLFICAWIVTRAAATTTTIVTTRTLHQDNNNYYNNNNNNIHQYDDSSTRNRRLDAYDCQAIDGVYKEGPVDDAVQGAPAIQLDVEYKVIVALPPWNDNDEDDDASLTTRLTNLAQQHVAQALVPHLWTHCANHSINNNNDNNGHQSSPRDNGTATMPVDLQQLSVTFSNDATSTIIPRTNQVWKGRILIVGAQAVAPAEKALADEHLKTALQRALAAVPMVTIEMTGDNDDDEVNEERLITLRYQPSRSNKDAKEYQSDDHNQGAANSRLTRVVKSSSSCALLFVVALLACFYYYYNVVRQRRHHKAQHVSYSELDLPSSSSLELSKWPKAMLPSTELDDTENSEDDAGVTDLVLVVHKMESL